MYRHLIARASRFYFQMKLSRNNLFQIGRKRNEVVRQLLPKSSGSSFNYLIAAGLLLGVSSGENSGFVSKIQRKTMDLERILTNADKLFESYKFQESLDELKLHENQLLPAIKWRMGRAIYKLAREEPQALKRDLMRQAFALISESVAEDDSNYEAHQWMAILLDRKAELDGIMHRIKQAPTVLAHMQRSSELNPEDPTAWYLLGGISFGLADLAWYERQFLAALLTNPPTSTYEEALEFALRAEDKNETFHFKTRNLVLIGRCYLALKNQEKAKEYLTRAVNMEVLDLDDKEAIEEATPFLKSL